MPGVSEITVADEVVLYLRDADLANTKMCDVAAHFGVCENTLIKWLDEENTRFGKLKQQVRLERFSQYENDLVLQDLGFTNAGSFYNWHCRHFGRLKEERL